jgi:hypothetical protein
MGKKQLDIYYKRLIQGWDGSRITRDSLGLDNLEDGYDSLQIRISFDYNSTDTFQVLNIKRNNGHWNGYLCVATYLLNKTHDTVLRYVPIAFIPERRNNWGEIVDSLISFHIMNLPDQRKIISINEFPFDGANAVESEVADAHQYRIYSYEWPSKFRYKHKEAEDVYKIVNFLASRLGLHYLGSF